MTSGLSTDSGMGTLQATVNTALGATSAPVQYIIWGLSGLERAPPAWSPVVTRASGYLRAACKAAGTQLRSGHRSSTVVNIPLTTCMDTGRPSVASRGGRVLKATYARFQATPPATPRSRPHRHAHVFPTVTPQLYDPLARRRSHGQPCAGGKRPSATFTRDILQVHLRR